MKVAIPVKNRQEADAITRGLEDLPVRAFVVMIGALLALPSDRARERTLLYLKDWADEEIVDVSNKPAGTA